MNSILTVHKKHPRDLLNQQESAGRAEAEMLADSKLLLADGNESLPILYVESDGKARAVYFVASGVAAFANRPT